MRLEDAAGPYHECQDRARPTWAVPSALGRVAAVWRWPPHGRQAEVLPVLASPAAGQGVHLRDLAGFG